MEILKKLHAELAALKARFIDLVDPEAINVKAHEVIAEAVTEIGNLHAMLANIEKRFEAVEVAVGLRKPVEPDPAPTLAAPPAVPVAADPPPVIPIPLHPELQANIDAQAEQAPAAP